MTEEGGNDRQLEDDAPAGLFGGAAGSAADDPSAAPASHPTAFAPASPPVPSAFAPPDAWAPSSSSALPAADRLRSAMPGTPPPVQPPQAYQPMSQAYPAASAQAYPALAPWSAASEPAPAPERVFPPDYPLTPLIKKVNPEDTDNALWTVLGFCVPLAGIVLWHVWKRDRPRDARRVRDGFNAIVIIYAAIFLFHFFYTLIRVW